MFTIETWTRGKIYMLKALVIRVKDGMDMGDVLQIARSEGGKLFKNHGKINVVDLIKRSYGVVAVVQDSEVVPEGKAHIE
mgnify:CR=1 FL=1